MSDYRTAGGPRDAAVPIYKTDFDTIAYVSESCRDCVVTPCRSEAVVCATDPGCTAMAKCLALCDGPLDHHCRGNCNASIVLTSGYEAFTDLVRCEANQRACADCSSARSVRGGEPCDACLARSCPFTLDAFSKDIDALRLDACGCVGFPDGKPPMPGCACEAQYGPAGKPGLDALNACATGALCGADCSDPKTFDWSCLGHVQRPDLAQSVANIDVTFYVEDLLASPSIHPRFVVSACGKLDPGCTHPIKQETTDPTGFVHLVIPKSRTVDHFLAVGDTAVYAKQIRYFNAVAALPGVSGPSFYWWWSMSSRTDNNRISASFNGNSLSLPDGGLDPSKGLIALFLYSCLGGVAPGVVASGLGPGEFFGYFDANGAPITNGTQTSTSDLSAASSSLVQQFYTIDAKLAETDQLVGSYDVLVQADTMTLVTASPTK